VTGINVELPPGTIVGEMGLLAPDNRRTQTVECTQDGLVLTITRMVTRSVTPGLLIHVGYNLMLFGVLYIGTDHFRHLERMTQ